MDRIRGICILLFVVCICFPGYGQNNTKSYIEKYKDLAIGLMQESCIPASIILSIAIIESGCGKSKNCRLLNNHFGIKVRRGEPKTHKPIKSAYRKYETDTASYRHFCNMLMGKKFYEIVKYDTTYSRWIYFLNKYNYAGERGKWRAKVLNLIRKYDLHKFDELPEDDFLKKHS